MVKLKERGPARTASTCSVPLQQPVTFLHNSVRLSFLSSAAFPSASVVPGWFNFSIHRYTVSGSLRQLLLELCRISRRVQGLTRRDKWKLVLGLEVVSPFQDMFLKRKEWGIQTHLLMIEEEGTGAMGAANLIKERHVTAHRLSRTTSFFLSPLEL